MPPWRSWLAVLALTAALGPLPGALAEPKTAVRLLLSAEQVRGGDTVFAAIELRSAPRWHTYWRNPGESGLATTVEWTLPPGIRAGGILWPPPELYVAGGLTTYVYHGETLLLVPLTVASNTPAGPRELRAKVAWLECEEACVPADAQVSGQLTVAAETRPAPDADRIAAWLRRVPTPNPRWQVTAAWAKPTTETTRDLSIRGRPDGDLRPSDFLPYASEDYEIFPAVTSEPAEQGSFRLRKTVKRLGQEFPRRIPGILWQAGAGNVPTAAVEAILAPGAEADVTAVMTSPGELAGATTARTITVASVLAMVGLAFLGGLVLNIMPCVLPVIALKVLGFVHQSRDTPQRVRELGLLYGLGVIVSFLVLAGLVIAVQRAGGSASWGMQMQNPYFRLALLVTVTLVALNLFGLFEVTLASGALGAAAALATQGGGVGAFFNGVLATALATPCTAPFLTVALGFAFTQSAAVIAGTFLAAALGLATPYMVLSWRPGWLRFVPKPGPWMERFKTAMGFPMLATAIWLYDLTAPSFGEAGTLWLGLLLVVVACGAWMWGQFVQRRQGKKGFAAAAAVVLAGLVGVWILESPLDWRRSLSANTARQTGATTAAGIEWQPWSRAAVEKARGEGRPVLVDFTARWCLTCKSNEKFALDVPEVRAKLKQIKAVALRADHTNPDREIASELKRHGRAGVPLVVVFPRRLDRPPLVLPALLTTGMVLGALSQAAE